MSAVVDHALPLWGMGGAEYALIAARENTVYRVQGPNGSVAMRLHRVGYRTDAELSSELSWMAAAARGGMSVPSPISDEDGTFLKIVDGVQVDVLTWVPGDTLSVAMEQGAPNERRKLCAALGREMARLHVVSDGWDRPPGFVRVAWDADGLIGEAPVWGRFWDNPGLCAQDHALCLAFRKAAAQDLARLAGADYGLIHADLVPDNVMSHDGALSLIDFDDGGFGYRLFEVATALLKHLDAPDYSALKDALLEGYTAVRPMDAARIDLFMALRAATYVGWNIARLDEPGGAARNARFIARFCGLAEAYLRDG